VATLDEIGEQDDWMCWLCDKPVDPDASVNDGRGPSVDSRITKKKAKKKVREMPERLAHRDCNTGKGNSEAVVAWADHLFVVDPAVILTTVDRLAKKNGREAVGRCPTRDDAEEAGAWLLDRLQRLEPTVTFETAIEPGGGQFLLLLKT